MRRNTRVFVLFLALLCSFGFAQAQPGQIAFEADQSVIDNQKNFALYTGNVRITRDGATLTAQSVRFNYANSGKETSKPTLTTVVAHGGVHITFEDKTATADKAVYDAQTQTITLTGKEKPATVTAPQGTTSAGSFTIDRVSGKIEAHKSPMHRVKTTLKPGQDGLSFPENKK
ncbi:MAG: LptA/OstA family protein [Desulfobacterales bacterium]|nr:LptA/OstA family protein [Desulfobacterales bacterium]